jgi:heptosyltransferase-1
MAEPRLLAIRMGSLGDIVHTLPAVSALRDAFPNARIDWLVEKKWAPLLEGNPTLSAIIPIERKSWSSVAATVRQLRAARYTTAIDFQGLYKSALPAFASGASQRIGFAKEFAREPGACRFYNRHVTPTGRHKVEHNLSLAEAAGARRGPIRFPLAVNAEEHARVLSKLEKQGIAEFFVVSPGGGWRSKCWPPERFGELHRKLREQFGWRGIISYGPGEEQLAAEVCRSAGDSQPVALPMDLRELMAILRRAKFVVAADTGPLHLAAAMGVPVVGLYGPTDPARNGPFPQNVVITNAAPADISYKRGSVYSATMLSITVEQVLDGVRQRLGGN